MTTFSSRHFNPNEIVSSDRCMGKVGDDENNQAVTNSGGYEILLDENRVSSYKYVYSV